MPRQSTGPGLNTVKPKNSLSHQASANKVGNKPEAARGQLLVGVQDSDSAIALREMLTDYTPTGTAIGSYPLSISNEKQRHRKARLSYPISPNSQEPNIQ